MEWYDNGEVVGGIVHRQSGGVQNIMWKIAFLIVALSIVAFVLLILFGARQGIRGSELK